jgi:heat shock protein HslJ
MTPKRLRRAAGAMLGGLALAVPLAVSGQEPPADPPAVPAPAAVPLEGTDWIIVTLADVAVGDPGGRVRPHLLLGGEGGPGRLQASVGCNSMAGPYRVTEGGIEIGPLISTRMACTPPLDALERRLGRVLAAARGWRIDGTMLTLADGRGETVATFRAAP